MASLEIPDLNLNGLFLLDKPVGARSTDCVNQFHAALLSYVRSHLHGSACRTTGASGQKIKIRTGHAGTLDSTASGLLILLVGRATRLSDYIMMLPKVYRATLRLGQATDTCDYSGQVIFQGSPESIAGLTSEKLDRILPSFWGWRMQRPPEISALKINGRPSHKLARSGRSDLKPAPRPVFLRSVKRTSELKIIFTDALPGVPVAHVDLEVSCSKGTYIRSLARDIGEALGCGACIESLRRVSVGSFHVDNALPLGIFSSGFTPDVIRSPREVAKNFNRLLLTSEAEARLLDGVATPFAGAGHLVNGHNMAHGALCVEGRDMIGFAEDDGIFLKPRANILLAAPQAQEKSQKECIGTLEQAQQENG